MGRQNPSHSNEAKLFEAFFILQHQGHSKGQQGIYVTAIILNRYNKRHILPALGDRVIIFQITGIKRGRYNDKQHHKNQNAVPVKQS